MTIAEFESISLVIFIGGLVALMGYIVWDLAKKSKAGRFGTIILFVILGAGVFAFLLKTILVELL